MTDTTTNLVEFVDDNEPEVADDQQDDQVNDQADDDADSEDDGSQDEAEDEDLEEVDYQGRKIKIPKGINAERMMHADYTRKTQEAAALTKANLEAQAKWTQLSEEVVAAKIEEKAVKDRLSDIQALSEADWQEVRRLDHANGTNNYDRLMREMNTLPGKLSALEAQAKAKESEALNQKSEARMKLIEQGYQTLVRDIPGWGPEYGAKLADFVKSDFGLTPETHGSMFEDPAMVKLAHAAFQAKNLQAKAKTQQRADQANATPLPKTNKGGAAPKAGLHDGLSTKEWADRRNRELAAKGRR
jgi:hypothetical protein